MINCKIDSRGRTTIPRKVLRALKLSAGDELSYFLADGRAILIKTPSMENPFAVFSEWNGCADRKAYGDL